MTDEKKLQKVRAEIERLKHQSAIDSDRQAERGLQSASIASFGKVKACEELLSFIDSMQKEPVSDDLDQAIDNYLATYFGGEKEKQDWPFLKKMAIHFAAWQKQQLMAKAVDGLVVCNNFTHGYKDILMGIPSYLNVDDEVKVIIIKED